jgi:hypothetical protein
MHRTIASCGLLVLFVGCGHKPLRAEIPHPATTGRVAAHSIEVPDPISERGYRISAFGVKKHEGPELMRDSLSDRVRLVRLDAKKICFDFQVVARSVDAPEFAAPEGASIVTPKGHKDARPTVEPKPMKEFTLSGTTSRGVQGPIEYAGDNGVRIVPDHKPVTVHEGGAQICFANDGIVTPRTEQIRLRTPTRDFAWDLRGSANDWSTDTIVYEGEIGPTH